VSSVGPAPVLAPADLAWVCDVVRAETAVVLDASKEYLVASRLLPLARRAGAADVPDYVARMRTASPAARWELVEAMTTNETSWFRDVEPFTYLRTSLLPALAAARSSTRSLRIWSAACSTGQEPYTIAMLLADAPELRGFRTEVLATDVDRTALARARAGTYSRMEVGRGLPADVLARHLEHTGAQWRVREAVRSAVRFSELNLARPFPDRGRFDVVFCRNVLIYFDTATKQQVLERLHAVLAPDGVLVLGAAETTLGVSTSWARVDGSRAALYRPLATGSGSAPTGTGAARPAQAPARPWGASPTGRGVAPPATSASPAPPSRRPAAPPAPGTGAPRTAAPPPRAAPPVLPPHPVTPRAAPPRAAPPRAAPPRAATPRAAPPRVVPPRAAPARPAAAPPTRAAATTTSAWTPQRPVRPSAAPPPGPVSTRPPVPRREPTRPDTGRPDTGRPDTGRPDTGRPDTGRPDTGRAGGRPTGSARPDSGGDR